MQKIEVKINEKLIAVALSKLLRELKKSKILETIEIDSLWDLVEQLDTTTFVKLHKNVYFADFLRQIYINTSNNQKTHQNTGNKIELSSFESSESRIIDTQANDELELESVTLQYKPDVYQSDIVKTIAEQETKSDSSQGNISIPNLATPLDKVNLPERFLKLIKRLRNASLNNLNFNLGDDLKSLIDLSVTEVASLNGVGVSYVDTFKELKVLVAAQYDNFQAMESLEPEIFDFTKLDTSNFVISMYGVEQRFIKPLVKYAKYTELAGLPDLTRRIDLILSFDKQKLRELSGFGRGAVDALMEFKAIVQSEMQAIARGEIDYLAFQSKLIVPVLVEEIPLRNIEQFLLEDIDNLLDKLPDDEVDIAQRRWGFVEDKETLEEVGERFNVTRERIRQKEVKINGQLCLNLRINSQALWLLLEPNMHPSLKDAVSDLYECFSSEKAFYEFLEIICQQEKLFEYVYPEIDKTILNAHFAENGAPIYMQDAIDIIDEAKFENVRNSTNAILNLKNHGVLVVEGDYIWPKLLGKSEASACVLVNHPKGLPWLDIAKLANGNAFSRSKIYEDRLDTEAFNNKDYIYLAGKGVYKHTRFMDAGGIELVRVFAELEAYMRASSREVIHLNECYQTSEYLKQFNYYEIRYFVKYFGEDYGFYFDGRSQADSVGREKFFKNITQRDVILEAMNSREKPFTKPEIAGLLKSKSMGHASFYLDGMVDEAKIVQVDRQLYTTPKQAYKHIDLTVYLDAMQRILEKNDKPVEASIFQHALNQKMSVNYSKYFYLGIARCFSADRGWYRAHGLYSITPIPFKNITDALNIYCDREESIKKSVEQLQQHIAIATKNASQVINNWRNLTS